MSSFVLHSPNLADGEAPLVVRLYEAPRPLPFKNGGLALAASAVRSAGRGGDEVLLHINPQEFEFLKREWGEPSINPHTKIPEYGLFSKLKRALKFEAFNVKKIAKGVFKDPKRLIFGIDPLGTKIGNKVMGTNDKALVNQLGGATDDTFAQAKARGMDTGLAKGLHTTAGLIAGWYGGNALGNLASTGLGKAAQGLQAYADANTLSPVITTAQSTNAISPVVVTAGQTAAPTGIARAAGTMADAARTGSGALANLGDKAIDYAKQPSNWGTIAKGVGALGALGAGGGSEQAEPPEMPDSPGLRQLPFNRALLDPNFDWYTYGERPEAAFYAENVLPEFVPDNEETPAAADGGATSRFVRGPGTGRSDSIDARLSDGEYVLTAEDVALLGDGSSEAGARRLDEFRKNLRKHKGAALARGKISPDAKSPLAYLRGTR